MMLRTAHTLVGVTGLFAAAWLSQDFQRHGQQLLAHLDSGSWEAQPGEEVAATHIRGVYEGDSSWAIHFVSGQFDSFPMEGEQRAETVAKIGRMVLADRPTLIRESASLPEAFGDYLSTLLLTLGARQQDEEVGDDLRELASLLSSPRRPRLPAEVRKAYDRANEMLAAFPEYAPFRSVIQKYRDHERDWGLDFPAFGVATDPPYERDDAWDARSITLEPQVDRCRGVIRATNGAPVEIEGDAAVRQRLVEMALVRPWFSQQVLEMSPELELADRMRFFGDDGMLRVVPQRLWAGMGSELTLRVVGRDTEDQIEKWALDGVCCRIECEGVSYSLREDSVRSVAEHPGEFVGRTSTDGPYLIAISSRVHDV